MTLGAGLALATLLVVLAAGLLWWRVEPMVTRWLDWRLQGPQDALPEVIPPDLEVYIASYPDEWARKDVRGAIIEDYARFRDWDRVRMKHEMARQNPTISLDAGAPDA